MTGSNYYRPRKIYQLSDDYSEIIGRNLFIIGGEMSNGTKCWYLCDEDGNYTDPIDARRWFSVSRVGGHLVAFLEAIN